MANEGMCPSVSILLNSCIMCFDFFRVHCLKLNLEESQTEKQKLLISQQTVIVDQISEVVMI